MGCLRRLKLHQSRMLQDFWSQVLHEGWLHSFLSVQRSSGLVGTCDPQIECASTRTSTGTSTQCGGKNWNGPTCCQSGCQCRHEGEWYSQCEPPAGNHMCGAAAETIIYAEDVHLEDRAGSAVSLNRVMMAGVAMMLVMGAGFTAIKVVRRQQQLSRDAESGTLLIDTYDATDTEDEEIPGTE